MYEPLSKEFLLNRGFCCHNKCKNCPYINKNMIPYLQNCPHQGEGWCLKCVKEMALENEYLKWFRINADFGPGEGDVIDYLNRKFEEETGHKLPKGWRNED